MNVIWFLIIGALAGFLAGKLTQGEGFGAIGNLIVGIVGAVLGGFAFGLLGMGPGNLLGELLTAVVGALIFLFLLSRFGGSKS